MVEARWPNVLPDQLVEAEKAITGWGTTSTHLADPSLPPGDWNGAQVDIVSGEEWGNYTRTIRNYVAGSGFDFDLSVDEHPKLIPRNHDPYFLF